MSIATEITRIQQAKADIKTAIEAKGVTVPSSATIDTYDDYVSQISGDDELIGLIERTATSINIPSGTTIIGNSAFINYYSLSSVTIPDSVTSIGNQAFSSCSGLTSVTIPSDVTSIGNQAFINCSSLTSVTIPNSVSSIGEHAFFGCYALTSVTIPNSVTSIGDGAFSYCSSLTSITIPNSVTSISDYTFEYCTSLTSVDIPSGVTNIGSQAFRDCTSLTSVTIPSGITTIGNAAFYNCTNLTSITVNAQNPPTLSSGALNNTNNCPIYVPAESVNTYKAANRWSTYASRIQAIPTHDNIIEYTASSKLSETTTFSSAGLHTYAFSGTSGELTITSHTFSDGVGTIVFNGDVERVGTYAFFRCSGATSITIPSSVSVFENQPFWGCTSLTDITIKATVAPTFDGQVFDNTNNCNINVPCESLVDYASDSMFYTYSWLSRLKGISPCTNKVRYNNSGTTCHDYDLYQVVALQSSTDNGSTWSYVSPVVTQEYLLERNSQSCGYVPTPTCSEKLCGINDNGEEFTIYNDGTDSLEQYDGIGNQNPVEATVGDIISTIGDYVFQNCTSLSSVTIPSSVTSIGVGAFQNCNSLESVTVNATTPPSLASGVFDGTSSNLVIYVPSESVETYKQAEGWSNYDYRIQSIT